MPDHVGRLNLPVPLLTEAANGPDAFRAFALALGGVAPTDQGTLANRPVSTPGTPGITGRIYYVVGDGTPANNGITWFDFGTGWAKIGSADPTLFNLADIYSNRPAASAPLNGSRFFATDQVAEYLCVAGSWVRVSTPAGHGGLTTAATPSPGFIFLNGQAWPATTGVYADLYARLGAPGAVPDLTRRFLVGLKAGDGDFGTLLGTGGERAHALTTAELAAHSHAITDVPHAHDLYNSTGGSDASTTIGTVGSVEAPDGSGNGSDNARRGPITIPANTGITGTNPAGSGTAHNNLPVYLTVNWEAKL